MALSASLDVPAKEKSLHRNYPLDATLLAECRQSSICCKHQNFGTQMERMTSRLPACGLRLATCEGERGRREQHPSVIRAVELRGETGHPSSRRWWHVFAWRLRSRYLPHNLHQQAINVWNAGPCCHRDSEGFDSDIFQRDSIPL